MTPFSSTARNGRKGKWCQIRSDDLEFRIVREAIEMELHPYSINREGGFCLSKSWKPLIGSLKFSGHDPRTLGDTVPHS
jgi:hypothetical protein